MDWMDEQSCFFTDGYAIDGLEYGGVGAVVFRRSVEIWRLCSLFPPAADMFNYGAGTSATCRSSLAVSICQMGESARTPALRCLPDAGRLRLTHSGETSLVTAAGSRQQRCAHAGPACTGPGDHLTSSAGECGGGTPPLMWPIAETRQLHDRHQMVSGGLRRRVNH